MNDELHRRIHEWQAATPADSGLTETLLVIEIQNAVRASLERSRAIMDHVERMEAIGALTESDIARLALAQAEVRRLRDLLNDVLGSEARPHLDHLIEVSNLLN